MAYIATWKKFLLLCGFQRGNVVIRPLFGQNRRLGEGLIPTYHCSLKLCRFLAYDDRLMCYRKPITLTYEFDEDLTRESEENLRKAQVAPLETEDYTEDYV